TSAVELAVRHLQHPPPSLPSTTPHALGAVVERALAKDPDHRYRDGAEMADALARTRGSLPSSSVQAGASRPSFADSRSAPRGPAGTLIAPWTSSGGNASPVRRRGTSAAFSIALVLLLALIGGAILLGSARQVRVP